jgi:hypothetical protein
MSMTDSAQNISMCNQSLGMLGAEAITLAATTEQNYIYCAAVFDDARDEILALHKWNFAKKRAFAIQTTDPLFGYDNAFTPPSDYIRILQIEEDAGAEFEVENALILTDEGETPSDWVTATDYLVGDYLQSDSSGSTLTYVVGTAFTSSTEATDLSSYCTSQSADLDVLKVEYIYQHTTFSTWPVYAKQCLVLNLARMLCSAIKQNEEVAMNLQAMLHGSRKVIGYLDIARSLDSHEGGYKKAQKTTWIDDRS